MTDNDKLKEWADLVEQRIADPEFEKFANRLSRLFHPANILIESPFGSLDEQHDTATGLAMRMQDDMATLPGQIWILTGDDVGATPRHPLVFESRWKDNDERALVLRAARALINSPLNFTRYTVMSEAYSLGVTVPPGETFERDRIPGRIADQPGRKEVLMIATFERSGHHRMSYYDVIRDPVKGESAPPVSRVLDPTVPQEIGGDLWDMFQRKAPLN